MFPSIFKDSPEDDEKVDSQSESEEEPPPLPPPRTESLRPERPAPISVESSPSSSPDEESPPGASPTVEQPTGAAGENKPIENGVDKLVSLSLFGFYGLGIWVFIWRCYRQRKPRNITVREKLLRHFY